MGVTGESVDRAIRDIDDALDILEKYGDGADVLWRMDEVKSLYQKFGSLIFNIDYLERKRQEEE
jgi:hypothetical protein